jgi:hypothetical protein
MASRRSTRLSTRLSSKIQLKRTPVETTSRKEHDNCFICNVYLGPYRNALNLTLEDSDKTISEQLGEKIKMF